ncbi:MAG: chemotaxis protein CheV [Candidatus Aureabacteria bacterium]|nr:chemotaxis protein CheV [Candidatus Auribacterota bacterium]
MPEKDEILLEGGTNEVEILEFVLREHSYGVNVAKVKQLIRFDSSHLSRVPLSLPNFMGLYAFRDTTIPLIDLGKAFDLSDAEVNKKSLVMVCEFNRLTNGFFIDEVKRIHRLSWQKMKPIDELAMNKSSCITGTVSIEERDIPLVDLESLLLIINPEMVIMSHDSAELKEPVQKTSTGKILIAEDSGVMRKQIVKKLKASGFENIEDFPDGEQTFKAILDYFERSQKEIRPVTDFFNLIITDIEMPQMDGLTLCRRVKQELRMDYIPVIIYSSLITEEMARKCDQVGADIHVSKPQMDKLVEAVKKYLKKP